LEFNLRLQEHIELARASRGLEAISYAQKYLSPWKTTENKRIGQAMNLLAFKSNTQCQPYKVKSKMAIYRSCLFTILK
jgi:macrophage erythroblast attacher